VPGRQDQSRPLRSQPLRPCRANQFNRDLLRRRGEVGSNLLAHDPHVEDVRRHGWNLGSVSSKGFRGSNPFGLASEAALQKRRASARRFFNGFSAVPAAPKAWRKAGAEKLRTSYLPRRRRIAGCSLSPRNRSPDTSLKRTADGHRRGYHFVTLDDKAAPVNCPV
jgi:hypothetical protein